jgi:hypothetical protein
VEAGILLTVKQIGLPFLQMNYRSFEYMDERIVFPLFLEVQYGSLCRLPEFQRYGGLSGVAEFRMWIAEIPLIIELFTLLLQVKYVSLSGVAELLLFIAEIPLIIEPLTIFFCR